MPKGFFPASVWATGTKAPASLVPKCGACGLFKTCLSPKMAVDGEGRKSILVVGEAPGAQEDEADRPFVGPAGKYLRAAMDEVGIDMQRDCWITNSLICRPPGNRIDDDAKIEHCRPNLTKTIAELRPTAIILLGSTAVRSLIGGIWRDSPGALTRWVGWTIPSPSPNAWVCPSYHPSYLLRMRDPMLDRLFLAHIGKAAVKAATGRPWANPPDWDQRVRVILDPAEAARCLDDYIAEGGEAAFDLECNTIKPEEPGGEIVSASVCFRGREAISFPWVGEVVEAMHDFIYATRVAKILANMKFDLRWCLHVFGRPVRNVVWDTMLAAHVLDNRQGICGLKFQAFVQFGAEAYDEAVGEFLKAHGNSRLNLAKSEVDLRTLLTYGGMDSLITYGLAQRQREQMREFFPT